MRLFAKAISKAIITLLFRVEAVNRENLPQSGGAILCANHVSAFDMLCITCSIERWVFYMAKEELFKIPLMGPFIRKMGAYPVKRGKGDIESVKTSIKLLKGGDIIGIFPEGTRSARREGKPAEPKAGVALLAVKTGVPIVPVAIVGNYKLFSKVKVIFGQPFNIETESGAKYTSAELEEFSKGIMDRVYTLMEER